MNFQILQAAIGQPSYIVTTFDGFVKSPNSLLRFILRFFMVRLVQIITQDLRASPILIFGEAFSFAIGI